jgi:hypothetical protein
LETSVTKLAGTAQGMNFIRGATNHRLKAGVSSE